MQSNHLFLPAVIEKIRFYTDEPVADAKATDSILVRLCVMPAIVDVMARLNLNMDNPVLMRHSVSLTEDEQYYQLPPNIGSIWRFAIMDEYGHIISEACPRGEFHPCGPGWSIEANILSIRPFPTEAETADIWYTPSGDFLPHLATGTFTVTDNESMPLASTITYGLRDTRPGAYAGAILRVVPTSGPMQERVIATHTISGSTHTVTVRIPFDPTLTSVAQYEIAPVGSVALYDAIALAASIRLGTVRNLDPRKMVNLERLYKSSMKTVKDHFSYMNLRTGKYVDKMTTDSVDFKQFPDIY
jgi:hypothetical protein